MSLNLQNLKEGEIRRLQPRLALFDVDGTLRGKDGTVSKSTKSALARLRDRGCLVGLASGRPLFSVDSLLRELGINGPSILCTGAQLIDAEKNALALRSIGQNLLPPFVQLCRKLQVGIELYTEDFYFVEKRDPLLAIHWTYQDREPELVRDLLEFAQDKNVVKTQIVLENERDQAKLEELRSSLPGLRFAVAHGAAHPELSFISVVSEEARPDAMLDILLKHLGILREEVISFGDGESDIPLLEKVGVGVAMGNAKDLVQRAATYITTSVDEDGIAYALDRLVFSE